MLISSVGATLTASRKAAFALEMEQQPAEKAKKRMKAGGVARQQGKERIPYPEEKKSPARDHMAATVGMNSHYITDAKKIQAPAPEVLDEVTQGTLTIPQSLSLCRVQLGSK